MQQIQCTCSALAVAMLAAPALASGGCPEDIDGDGQIGFGDVLAVLTSWSLPSASPDVGVPADIDGDGVVGRLDLALVLALLFGSCGDDGGEGTVSHAIVAIDNTAGNAEDGFAGGVTDFTFDLLVTVTGTSEWTTCEATALIDAQLGQFYQHPIQAGDSKPPPSALFIVFPALEFDSYFCATTVIPPGGAGLPPDIIGLDPTTETDQEVSAMWADVIEPGAGAFTIARYTLRLGGEPENPIEVVIAGSEPDKVLLASISGTSTHSATGSKLVPFAFDLVTAAGSGDLDANGLVDAADLATLLGDWGPTVECPPFLPADLDHDCDVDAADLAMLLGAWS